MGAITPVKYTTPDGVERDLRFTFGAQRRIVDRLGCTAIEALQKYQNGALPEILYACMYDEQGKPPENLDPISFSENADPEDAAGMMAALMSAVSKGKTPKNVLEALIRRQMEDEFSLQTLGSRLGVSPDSVSDSAIPISGTSPSASLTPSASSSEMSNESAASTQA